MAQYFEKSLVKNAMATDKKRKTKDPCWEGYEQIGMKEKKGRMVPNCVPKKKTKKGSKD